MILTDTLEDHLHRSMMLHARLCPRQVLGVRMARLACTLLAVDPARDRKALYVFMEIGHCTADAVMIVTTASPTNGLMQLMNYGKVAATFVRRSTGEAIRISERQEAREMAKQRLPDVSGWLAQRDAYQMMPEDQLFNWQGVELTVPLPTISAKHAVNCQCCSDRVHDHCEVIRDGQALCKTCAVGAYFNPVALRTQIASV